jgi:2-polyprenyl-6-methoxyphenol hydroxylase-like FAD-dependent oxidoreductase
MPDPSPRVLVAGAGIAGATLACLLGRQGQEVTVVERDDGVRPSGNPVDVRGTPSMSSRTSGSGPACPVWPPLRAASCW